MAFFSLTQMGYQDTIREHMNDPPTTPQHIFRSGLHRDKGISLPPIDQNPKKHADIVPNGQLSGHGPGHEGSYKEYMRLRHKHIRNPQEIQDVYRHPVITSSEVARWRRDEPLREKEPWMYVKRRIHVNSEMTRFVNEMCLTNREFSLF